MKVKIKFFTFFGNLCGVDKTELNLPQGATVKEVLEKIADDFPKLKKMATPICMGIYPRELCKPTNSIKK